MSQTDQVLHKLADTGIPVGVNGVDHAFRLHLIDDDHGNADLGGEDIFGGLLDLAAGIDHNGIHASAEHVFHIFHQAAAGNAGSDQKPVTHGGDGFLQKVQKPGMERVVQVPDQNTQNVGALSLHDSGSFVGLIIQFLNGPEHTLLRLVTDTLRIIQNAGNGHNRHVGSLGNHFDCSQTHLSCSDSVQSHRIMISSHHALYNMGLSVSTKN